MGSYRNQNKQPRYRFNHQITAPTIRLIQDKGGQIGIVSISEARQKAQETGLDLVEIAPKATPPVVKLINFAKFKYQESKKLKAEKKGSKKGELKEVQAKPFIGQGDYQTKLKRTIKFLNSGNKVKLSIKFLGRQIIHQEFGHDLVQNFRNDLKEIAATESEPRLIGKRLIVTFTPIKKKSTKKHEKDSQKI